jgi:hypothetical protein
MTVMKNPLNSFGATTALPGAASGVWSSLRRLRNGVYVDTLAMARVTKL